MKLYAGLLFLLLAVATAQAETLSQAGAGGFNARLAAGVFGTALAFIAPRTLDPVPIPDLTLWGLRGLTAIDPALTAELRDGTLRVAAPDRIVFAQKPPAADDAGAWGQAAAAAAEAAASESVPVRRAGTGGVIRSFFDELFNHLDPYSRYVPPAMADTDREHRSGVGGIGAQVARRGAEIVVESVLADGPAEDAGIQPGDRILAVNRVRVQRQSASTVAALLAGAEDTEVRLIIRTPRGRVRHVTVQRAMLPPETVFAHRDGDLLLIRITAFAADTAQRVENELRRAAESGRAPRGSSGSGRGSGQIRGIIFDLRGNRGGLLRQAVSAVDTVLDDGIISITDGRDPQSDHLFRATGGAWFEGVPVVVIVDGRSASAAEIFTAAIEDNRRGVVVGSATLGKGLVQTIAALPDGGELFVTWSRVLAPAGWPIQGLGVLPELCTSLGAEGVARQLDALASGRNEMAPALARHQAARAPLPAAQMLEIRGSCPAAEGQEADLKAARFLVDHQRAYEAALLPAAPPASPAAQASTGQR